MKSNPLAKLPKVKDLMGDMELTPATQAVFIPGRGEGDFERGPFDFGLLEWSVDVFRHRHLKHVEAIVIPGHDGSWRNGKRMPHGYPGRDDWESRLVSLGVPSQRVLPTTVWDPHTTHTREETDGFVDLAKQKGWETAVVVAYAHQMPRVMLSLLMSFEVHQHLMMIVPTMPNPTDWRRPVWGSGGEKQMPRHEQEEEERKRLETYPEKGHIKPLDDLEPYLLNIIQVLQQTAL